MTTVRRFMLPRTMLWLAVALLFSGGVALLVVGPRAEDPGSNSAREELRVYLTDYSTQLDTYQAALQTGNGPALARADSFLSSERPRLAQLLGTYLKTMTSLPLDQPLIAQLQALTEDARFQFTSTDLGGEGRLIQVSVTENEFDVRHLTLWQSKQNEILALNNYETEWQAQVNAVRRVKETGSLFLIANGQTRQLEEEAPFLKVYQRQGADFLDKTTHYLPKTMLDAFGTSEFIGPTANVKLKSLLLDPERIMAACDSCGLVSQQSLWQWSAQGYQQVSAEILNVEGNALYAALAALMKGKTAPAWADQFLTLPVRHAVHKFIGFDRGRYNSVEQGLVVTAAEPWGQGGMQYFIDGPVHLKVRVRQEAGKWLVVELKDLKVQAPGWSTPYRREPDAAVG